MALRNRMMQQVQLLFNELDRHGGAERLVASASRGAGSADNGESDDFPAAALTLCETSLREMSLDEVCESLSAKGLEVYVDLFKRLSLDGANLCEMDEPALLDMGLDRSVFCLCHVCVYVRACVRFSICLCTSAFRHMFV